MKDIIVIALVSLASGMAFLSWKTKRDLDAMITLLLFAASILLASS